MSAFPDLAVSPTLPIQRKHRENSLKSESESGYVQSRPRFTRKTYEYGPLDYPTLLRPEIELLWALYDEVGCDVIFTWTRPLIGSVHNVRFKEPPVDKLVGPDIWSYNCTLEEA